MTHKIYYFSATGNSLQITRQLSKKLTDCTIKSMATQPPNQPVGGPTESIGFVFPVYYFGIPRIVKRFVENLPILPETYCFAITNFGATPLDTLGMLDDILQKKNLHLSYADGVAMPDNYIARYDAVEPKKAQKMIETAASRIDEAAQSITQRKLKPVKRKAKLLGKMVSRPHLIQGYLGVRQKI